MGCPSLLTAGRKFKTLLQPVTTLDRRVLVNIVVITETKEGEDGEKLEVEGVKESEKVGRCEVGLY